MASVESKLREVADLARGGESQKAFCVLRQSIAPEQDYMTQLRAARAFKALPADGLDLRPLKIAVVPGFTVDYLLDIVALWLAASGIRADFHVAPFDAAVQTVMDENSGLYGFRPDAVWLMTSHRDVRLDIAPGDDVGRIRERVAESVALRATLWRTLAERLNCIVIQNNADVPAYDAFGNFAGAVRWGSRNRLHLYNAELAEQAGPGVVIFDLDHVSALFGKSRWVDSQQWFLAKVGFNLEACGLFACHAARLIAAARGLA